MSRSKREFLIVMLPSLYRHHVFDNDKFSPSPYLPVSPPSHKQFSTPPPISLFPSPPPFSSSTIQSLYALPLEGHSRDDAPIDLRPGAANSFNNYVSDPLNVSSHHLHHHIHIKNVRNPFIIYLYSDKNSRVVFSA